MNEPTREDWGGWAPHAEQRRRSVAAMTPLERIEWLERMLLGWDERLLLAERARRQAAIDVLWASTAD